MRGGWTEMEVYFKHAQRDWRRRRRGGGGWNRTRERWAKGQNEIARERCHLGKSGEKRKEKRDSTKKENNHRDYAEIISPRASRVIKLRGSPAWYLPLAYPFLLFLFVVNSFLALNLNPFFTFNFASTYLPCSMDLPPEEKEEEEEEEEQEEMVVAKPR